MDRTAGQNVGMRKRYKDDKRKTQMLQLNDVVLGMQEGMIQSSRGPSPQ